MHTQPSRRLGSPRIVRDSSKLAAYAELLALHDNGRQAGAPLLTVHGETYVRNFLRLNREPPAARRRASVALHSVMPRWDGDSRTLWLGPELLKEFVRPAPCQAAVLAAFERRGWDQGHITNPLPAEPWESVEDAKARLHETIKNLNRGLPSDTICFHGDGTGTGVRWTLCHPTPEIRDDSATA
jgi:hypothetical protein